MKQILTTVFTFLTITTFAQPNKYFPLDYSYKFNSERLMEEKLKGSIRSLTVYTRENNNFHHKSQAIDLNTELHNAQTYIITSDQLTEVHTLNYDSTVRSRELYSNGLIQKFIFYQKDTIIQKQDTFLYNQSNQLIEKIIKDGKGNIQSSTKFSYNGENQLEEVINDHGSDYKYIYDDVGGFYEVKYDEIDGGYSILEARYRKQTNSEKLEVLLQIRPDAKFEDVANLKRTWQALYKMDECNRITLDQTKDLLLDLVGIERSFTYQNDRLVSKTYKSKHGTDEISKLIYKNNMLVREVSKDKEGYETFTRDLQYNEHGDLHRLHQEGIGIGKEVYEYAYTYDSHNNWIQKKETLNGKLFQIIYRTIIYEK